MFFYKIISEYYFPTKYTALPHGGKQLLTGGMQLLPGGIFSGAPEPELLPASPLGRAHNHYAGWGWGLVAGYKHVL